jgi:hypothetical protein
LRSSFSVTELEFDHKSCASRVPFRSKYSQSKNCSDRSGSSPVSSPPQSCRELINHILRQFLLIGIVGVCAPIVNLSVVKHMEEIPPAVSPKDNASDQAHGSVQSFRFVSDENDQGDETQHPSNILHSTWDPQGFEPLMTLGKGNYAAVYLVEAKQARKLYAMKVRNKRLIHESSERKYVSTEKAILLLAKRDKHPFIVEVYGGFQTQSHIILYLEFCQGGDLMHHIQSGKQFDVDRARCVISISWYWREAYFEIQVLCC